MSPPRLRPLFTFRGTLRGLMAALAMGMAGCPAQVETHKADAGGFGYVFNATVPMRSGLHHTFEAQDQGRTLLFVTFEDGRLHFADGLTPAEFEYALAAYECTRTAELGSRVRNDPDGGRP